MVSYAGVLEQHEPRLDVVPSDASQHNRIGGMLEVPRNVSYRQDHIVPGFVLEQEAQSREVPRSI